MALADVYDALSSARCYKEVWEEDRVVQVIQSEAAGQFDPTVVEAFFSCIDVIHNIKKTYPE